MPIVIEAHYLPGIAYFKSLANAELILIEKKEYFVKQSYRSRCHINTEHGRDVLLLPVTNKTGKTLIESVRIDYNQKWLNNHWRTIQSAYAKAPFFEFYADDLHAILFKKNEFLFDLNVELLTMCLKWLRISAKLEETSQYEMYYGENIIDCRNVFTPKNQPLEESFYPKAIYTQVFGNNFVKPLSLLDLIFCQGPQAKAYLQAE
ncbi:MAG: WbqC family protein [Chryseotalea sp.]